MARNVIEIDATPESVFAVLDDARAYPRWVVGTRRIRAVDSTWPEVGSRFHHAVGTAAAELHDSSKVLARVPPSRMTLEVRFRPTGVAEVDIELRPTASGTAVALTETPTSGPVSWLPRFVTDPLLSVRNTISLQRFRHEVELRSAHTAGH